MRKILMIAGWILLACGCDSGPRLYEVTGKVTLDGVPVAKGDVTFRAENPSIPPQGASIKEGVFSLKANEGKFKVEIIATRPVPGKKGPMGEDAIEEYIPEQYNTNSRLSAEVKPSPKNTITFDLTSKK